MSVPTLPASEKEPFKIVAVLRQVVEKLNNVVAGAVADGSIANAKLADMAQATFKMRAAGAGTGVPIDGTVAQAWAALGFPQNYLSGLGLANNGSDATNDIDVAAGVAAESTNVLLVTLSSGLTKRLDANWAAGTNQGMRNSAAAITDTTYHLYLVAKASGADADIYAHTSTTVSTVLTALQAETGGSSYIYARRIGSIMRVSGAIMLFRQYGDLFNYEAAVTDRNSTSAAANSLLTISVPLGIKVRARLNLTQTQNAAGSSRQLIGDGDMADTVFQAIRVALAGQIVVNDAEVMTNTSAEIRFAHVIDSGSVTTAFLSTVGYYDTRGRDG